MPAPDSDIVTIQVPFTVRKRGGRKLVLAPDSAPMLPAAPHIDSPLVKRHCPRLPVAEDAGDRSVRHDQGDWVVS
ncbi:hypothetical protein [Reyranella sp.]|uniref:hypothetical protein n=1 Tax=Reyranella sp. TaxID=1929291 RepID=UPI004035D3D5